MMGMEAEVENLRAVVSRYFRVYETIVHPLAVTFKVVVDPGTLDATFDGLRRELVPQNYVPAIAIEAGEHVVHVQRRPQARFAKPYVNIILLVVTLGTTLISGAFNWAGYTDVPLFSLESLVLGFVSFSVPLLLILGTHEMGHYFTAKKYHVHASLPFLLPSVPPLGTFGAFISMRDPIPNRKALLDIGLAGPVVGFLVSIPVIFAGLWLTLLNPREVSSNIGGQLSLGSTFLFDAFVALLPIPPNSAVHPTLFAGWVGLFVTSINLLPAGQLDGGHVARALLGARANVLSWVTIFALLAMGVAFYPSWLIFALVILMLGARHPPPLNDITRLENPRKLAAALGIVLLVLTFAPQPFVQVPVEARYQFEPCSPPFLETSEIQMNATAGTTSTLCFRVDNTGNTFLSLALTIDPKNLEAFGWSITFTSLVVNGMPSPTFTPDRAQIVLNSTEVAVVGVDVSVPSTFPSGTVDFSVVGNVPESALQDVTLTVRVTVRP